MKPDQFTADFSARLRQQGVDFDPAALKEFAADLDGMPSYTRDAGTLAEWFKEASGRYAVEARRRFVARLALREGLLFSVYVIIGGCMAAYFTCAVLAANPPRASSFILMAFLAAALPLLALAAGIAGIVRAVKAAKTLRRSREEMEAAFRREPPLDNNVSTPTRL